MTGDAFYIPFYFLFLLVSGGLPKDEFVERDSSISLMHKDSYYQFAFVIIVKMQFLLKILKLVLTVSNGVLLN